MESEIKTFQIWVEGYAAPGHMKGEASLVGTFEADTFDEAVLQHVATLPPNSKTFWRKNEKTGKWSWWGCQLHDNEADARKAFD